jgi:pilus assembly protein CpaC
MGVRLMKDTRMTSSKTGFRRLALVASLSAVLAPNLAFAAEPAMMRTATSSVLGIGAGEGTSARPLDLAIGRSVIVELPRDAKEVFVANPAVANAVVRSTRKVFLIGVANGATSVFVMDAEGRQIATLEVNVGRDLNVLRQTLRQALPSLRIEIKTAGDSILLTGVVSSASEAQQVVDIAKAFVGQSGGEAGAGAGAPSGGGAGGAAAALGGGTVSGNVINALTINGRDQVMLRVTVAEVSRNILKQLGVQLGDKSGAGSGQWSSLANIASATSFPVASQVLATANTISAGVSGNSLNIGATLQAFERAGVSRVLAEPTLVAISGEAATFTAGGEIPVPSNASCATGTTGVQQCVPSVEFKPFGVNLAFTPVVLSEGRISMRINTEVTDVDTQNSVRFGTINVPGFSVRKSSTSVELPSGATMMTAGLLSQKMGGAISGVPGLLNLPILGALFRSRDYQRQETELVIMVTPYISKPMEAAQASRPDDGFVDAQDPQGILLGRLNKLYGVAGPAVRAKSLTTRFGFITD